MENDGSLKHERIQEILKITLVLKFFDQVTKLIHSKVIFPLLLKTTFTSVNGNYGDYITSHITSV